MATSTYIDCIDCNALTLTGHYSARVYSWPLPTDVIRYRMFSVFFAITIRYGPSVAGALRRSCSSRRPNH